MNHLYYGKIAVALVLALITSSVITTYVTFANVPAIRPEFTLFVSSLPDQMKSIAFLPTKLFPPRLPAPEILPPDIPANTPLPIQPPEEIPTPPPAYERQPTESVPTSPILPTIGTRPPTRPPPTQPPAKTVEESRAEFLAIINKNRSPLTLNPLLTASAQKYADLLTQKLQSGEETLQTLCTHEYGGTTPQSRAQKEGFSGGFVSENAYCGPASAQVAFDSWMSDDLHKNNMLSTSWHQSGIGVSGFWVLDLAP